MWDTDSDSDLNRLVFPLPSKRVELIRIEVESKDGARKQRHTGDNDVAHWILALTNWLGASMYGIPYPAGWVELLARCLAIPPTRRIRQAFPRRAFRGTNPGQAQSSAESTFRRRRFSRSLKDRGLMTSSDDLYLWPWGDDCRTVEQLEIA